MTVVDVVMRCRNEMPWAERALAALAEQDGVDARVLFIDCDSSDGSREAAESAGVEIVDFDPRQYVPGVVLNLGMERTETDVVAFINADAIALLPDALQRLIAPLVDPTVAATYARQVARPDADAQTRADYERAFPAWAELETRFGEFFSMAASAIRRDAWETLPFDPQLRYSEDVDWTHRLRLLGWRVGYVADAPFEHSHDYDLRGELKRRRGEGTADRLIYRIGPPSVVRDLMRPLAGSLLRDARAGLLRPRYVANRVAQAFGYYDGRRRDGFR